VLRDLGMFQDYAGSYRTRRDIYMYTSPEKLTGVSMFGYSCRVWKPPILTEIIPKIYQHSGFNNFSMQIYRYLSCFPFLRKQVVAIETKYGPLSKSRKVTTGYACV